MDVDARWYISRLLKRVCIDHDDLCNPRFYQNKIRYLASGRNNDVFKLKVLDAYMVLKVGYLEDDTVADVRKSLDLQDKRIGVETALRCDPCNVAFRFCRLANILMARRLCPHFVIMLRHCLSPHFLQALGNVVPDRVLKLRRQRNKVHDVSLLELYDSDLQTAILKRRILPEDVKGCVFQVLFSLIALHSVKPHFRHNDLHNGNVMLRYIPYNIRQDTRVQYLWSFDEEEHPRRWIFPTWTQFAAIGDFDFVNLGNGPANAKVSSNLYRSVGITTGVNRSYDSHLFVTAVARDVNVLVKSKNDPGGSWQKLLTWLSQPYNDVFGLLLSDTRQRSEDLRFTPQALITSLFPTVSLPKEQMSGGSYMHTFGNVKVRSEKASLSLQGVDFGEISTLHLMEMARCCDADYEKIQDMTRAQVIAVLEHQKFFNRDSLLPS